LAEPYLIRGSAIAVPEYKTTQIPIEKAEVGMTVLFPDDESLFRIKVLKFSYKGKESLVTLTEDIDVPRTSIDQPGSLLRRVVGTFDD
jgi:hypothetical protein